MIRKATKEDVQAIYDLILELAIYENAKEEVTNSVQGLLEDGFGENPLFGCFVAEVEHKVVGVSLYYFRYSTWKRKRLYLEDIIVTKNFRNRGIGKALLENTIEEAKATGCTGLMWQVLDWNTSAIEFYKKYNANFDGEWINVSLEIDEGKA